MDEMSKVEELTHDTFSFGHGQDNPDGMRMQFEYDENGARTIVNIAEKFQGWPGIAHGGIVATCLDEAMGHAVAGRMRSFSMSVELEVFYLAPTMTKEDLLLEGKVVAMEDRKISTVAELRRKCDNTLLAHAKALFIMVKGGEEELHEIS